MPTDSSWEERRTQRGTERAIYPPVNINQAVRTAEVDTEFLVVPNTVSAFRDYLPNGSDDDSSGANDGSVSFSNGEYTVSVPGSASGEQQAFETARIGTYRPGHVAVAGIYVRKSSDPVGKAEWGYKREGSDDGIYLRLDSDGSLTFVIERGGTETQIPESDWDADTDKDVTDENGDTSGHIWGYDRLDGGGYSGINLDVSDGYIYRFPFSWYGGGSVGLEVVASSSRGRQRPWPAVIYEPIGQPSINQPNQPLFARVDTQSSTGSDSLTVQGRQFSVFGQAQDLQRRTEHLNTGVSLPSDGTDTEVITFRRKSGDEGVEMDVVELDVQTNQSLHGYLIIDPDFNTTPSYSAPSGVNNASETAIEVEDESDADLSTGDPYGGFLMGSGKNTQSISGVGERDFPVPRQKPVVVVLGSESSQSATVDASLNVGEKW